MLIVRGCGDWPRSCLRIGGPTSQRAVWFTAGFQPRQELAGPDPKLASRLGVTSLVMIALAVFFRWLCFGFLIHPKRVRPGSWMAAVIAVVGALLVSALIKSVEISGFVLWLQSQSWPHYLAFAVPACLLSLAAIPPWLMRRTGAEHF